MSDVYIAGVSMTHFGKHLDRSLKSLAGEALASTLGLSKGAPVLVAHRTARSQNGLPIEFAVITYRADRYRFRVEL